MLYSSAYFWDLMESLPRMPKPTVFNQNEGGKIFASLGVFGIVWRHFWRSQLEWCYWHLVSWGQGGYYTFYNTQRHLWKRNSWPKMSIVPRLKNTDPGCLLKQLLLTHMETSNGMRTSLEYVSNNFEILKRMYAPEEAVWSKRWETLSTLLVLEPGTWPGM